MKHLNWLVAAILYKHNDERVYNGDTRLEDLCCLDVKYQYQTHLNMCPEACENMVKHYHHESICSLDDNPRGVFEGRELSNEFIKERVSHFYQLKELFHQYGPLILTIPMRQAEHFITMTGYCKDHIIYHDSLTGPNRIISFNDLKDLCASQDIKTAHLRYQLIDANINHQLNDDPTDLVPPVYQKYCRFFTVLKMETPQRSIIELLNAYIDTKLATITLANENHKELVKNFIETNRDKPLEQLLIAINNELKQISEVTKDELDDDIAVINYFCLAK